MKRDKIKEKAVTEYITGGRSYRELEAVYGIASSTLQRWVAASGLERRGVDGEESAIEGETPAEEIRRLRRELDEARLHGKLLEAMIEIAEEQYDIPIRKKRGAKPRSCWRQLPLNGE
jgi:transposase